MCAAFAGLSSDGRLLEHTDETVELAREIAKASEAPVHVLERAGGDRALVEPARRAWTALDELSRLKTSSLGSQAPLVYDDLETALGEWGRVATRVAGRACRIDAVEAVDGLRAGQYRIESYVSTVIMSRAIRRAFRRDALADGSLRAVRDAVGTIDHSFQSMDLSPVPKVVRRDHAAMIRKLRAIRGLMRRMVPAIDRRDVLTLQRIARRMQDHAARFDDLQLRIHRRLERGVMRSGGQPA